MTTLQKISPSKLHKNVIRRNNKRSEISNEDLELLLKQPLRFQGAIYVAIRDGHDIKSAIREGKMNANDPLTGTIQIDQPVAFNDGVQVTLHDLLNFDDLPGVYIDSITSVQISQDAYELAFVLGISEREAKRVIRDGAEKMLGDERFKAGHVGQGNLDFDAVKNRRHNADEDDPMELECKEVHEVEEVYEVDVVESEVDPGVGVDELFMSFSSHPSPLEVFEERI